MKKYLTLAFVTGLILYFLKKMKKVPTPALRWKRFRAPGTVPLDAVTCKQLEGIYTITSGTEVFGKSAVMKWSYTVEAHHTFYHLSLFCEKEGAYLVCEGRRSGNEILLGGYWRKLSEQETGAVQLVIENPDLLLSDQED